MNITVLVITHRHGTNVYPCLTEDIANAKLYEFVKEWWHEVCEDDPMPTDHQEAIDDYFNSDLCDELYDIFTEPIIELMPNQEVSA